jgi:hypothetical protein
MLAGDLGDVEVDWFGPEGVIGQGRLFRVGGSGSGASARTRGR